MRDGLMDTMNGHEVMSGNWGFICSLDIRFFLC